MDEKTIRFFMSGLQDAVADLISEEIGWCEGFCEKNPTHRQERERDRDLIVFGMQRVFLKWKRDGKWVNMVSEMTNTEKNIVLAALSSYRRKLMDQSVSFLRAGNHEDAKASTMEAANVNALVIKFTREKEFAI